MNWLGMRAIEAVAVAAIPSVCSGVGAMVGGCMVRGAGNAISWATGRVTLTVNRAYTYVIIDGCAVTIDKKKTYTIVNGELREIVEPLDAGWSVI